MSIVWRKRIDHNLRNMEELQMAASAGKSTGLADWINRAAASRR